MNPFGLDPAEDCVHAPGSEWNWSESFFFFAYEPKCDVMVVAYFATVIGRPDRWQAILTVSLPDRTVFVRKLTGKSPTATGPGTAELWAGCEEPMRRWTLRFDGMARHVPRAETARRALQDGPMEHLEFSITFDAAAPYWSLGPAMKGQDWASQHFEQAHTVAGDVRAGGRTYVFERGFGYRDRSYGPRDVSTGTGGLWCAGTFPSGRAFLFQYTRLQDSAADIRLGYVVRSRGGPLEIVEMIETPVPHGPGQPSSSMIVDPFADPAEQRLKFVFRAPDGERGAVTGRVLPHTSFWSWHPPSDIVIGSDLSAPPNTKHLTESAAEWIWDGEIGHGLRERTGRMHTLIRN